MSNTKPSVNYIIYDKKRKNNSGKPSQQQSLGKFHRSGFCLQTANLMLVENFKPKVKSVIDVGKADINQIKNVVPSMKSVTNVKRKDILL